MRREWLVLRRAGRGLGGLGARAEGRGSGSGRRREAFGVGWMVDDGQFGGAGEVGIKDGLLAIGGVCVYFPET